MGLIKELCSTETSSSCVCRIMLSHHQLLTTEHAVQHCFNPFTPTNCNDWYNLFISVLAFILSVVHLLILHQRKVYCPVTLRYLYRTKIPNTQKHIAWWVRRKN